MKGAFQVTDSLLPPLCVPQVRTGTSPLPFAASVAALNTSRPAYYSPEQQLLYVMLNETSSTLSRLFGLSWPSLNEDIRVRGVGCVQRAVYAQGNRVGPLWSGP
jgi:hypothetical protein